MKISWNKHRTMVLLMLLATMLGLLTGCGAGKKSEITSIDDLRIPGLKIGVALNTPEESLLRKDFPDSEIVPYNDEMLGFVDVANGRLDAFFYARKIMELAIENGVDGVRILDETYSNDTIAIGISPLSKIPGLENKLNKFLSEIKADGTMDEMFNRWVIQGDETMPDIPQPENPTITIKVATVGVLPPYTYYVGTELNGLDIEMAYRFAAWMNARVEFKVYDFSGVIVAAQGGDVDLIMSDLYYTPERAEALPFSESVRTDEIAVLVPDNSAGSSRTSFFSSLKENFIKTFIREDRWKMLVAGIEMTIFITVLSIILGTTLGFLLYLICRNGNPVANKVTGFCIWLVQGLPVVVLLMILYYIVFENLPVSGEAVSIIGFTLVFGSAVFGILKTGVGAIDKGQYEAAYTLGFSDTRAFFKIILPQALPYCMPAYKGEITAIIKATSIVGYIAVQDLTKVGDIIRSRTYEAFFTLFAVAVIYIILAALLIFIVNRIELRIDPRQRDPEAIRKEVERR